MSSNPPSATTDKPTRTGPSWLGYLTVGIVSGLVSGCVVSGVCLGAVFFVLPTARGVLPAKAVIEEGTAKVPLQGSKGELVVYYRQPFESPPQLTFPQGMNDCVVVEQKAGSFKLGRDISGNLSWQTVVDVKWRAEGVPAR